MLTPIVLLACLAAPSADSDALSEEEHGVFAPDVDEPEDGALEPGSDVPLHALATASTVPEGKWDLRFALGLRSDPKPPEWPVGQGTAIALKIGLMYGITDRLQLLGPTPAFAYRFGDQGAVEWIPWGGLTGWGVGYSNPEGVFGTYSFGLGVDTRWWLGDRQSFLFTWDVGARGYASRRRGFLPAIWPSTLTAGWLFTPAVDIVTIHVGAALTADVVDQGLPGFAQPTLRIGSVQALAYRPLPLFQLHVDAAWSLDGYFTAELALETGEITSEWLLGCTWIL